MYALIEFGCRGTERANFSELAFPSDAAFVGKPSGHL